MTGRSFQSQPRTALPASISFPSNYPRGYPTGRVPSPAISTDSSSSSDHGEAPLPSSRVSPKPTLKPSQSSSTFRSTTASFQTRKSANFEQRQLSRAMSASTTTASSTSSTRVVYKQSTCMGSPRSSVSQSTPRLPLDRFCQSPPSGRSPIADDLESYVKLRDSETVHLVSETASGAATKPIMVKKLLLVARSPKFHAMLGSNEGFISQGQFRVVLSETPNLIEAFVDVLEHDRCRLVEASVSFWSTNFWTADSDDVMNMSYSDASSIVLTRVCRLMKMGQKYQFNSLVSYCEKQLVQNSGAGLWRHPRQVIELVEVTGSEPLAGHCPALRKQCFENLQRIRGGDLLGLLKCDPNYWDEVRTHKIQVDFVQSKSEIWKYFYWVSPHDTIGRLKKLVQMDLKREHTRLKFFMASSPLEEHVIFSDIPAFHSGVFPVVCRDYSKFERAPRNVPEAPEWLLQRDS